MRLSLHFKPDDMMFWHIVSTGVIAWDMKTAHIHNSPWPTFISYIATIPAVFTGFHTFLVFDELPKVPFRTFRLNRATIIYLISVSLIIVAAFWLMQYAPEPPCSNDDYAAGMCIP